MLPNTNTWPPIFYILQMTTFWEHHETRTQDHSGGELRVQVAQVVHPLPPHCHHFSSLFTLTLPPKITAGGNGLEQGAGAMVVTDLVLVVKV